MPLQSHTFFCTACCALCRPGNTQQVIITRSLLWSRDLSVQSANTPSRTAKDDHTDLPDTLTCTMCTCVHFSQRQNRHVKIHHAPAVLQYAVRYVALETLSDSALQVWTMPPPKCAGTQAYTTLFGALHAQQRLSKLICSSHLHFQHCAVHHDPRPLGG